MTYKVKWEIELDADSPQAAAEKALVWIKNDYAICHTFTTKDQNDLCHSIDLDEDIDNQVYPLTLDQFHEIS